MKYGEFIKRGVKVKGPKISDCDKIINWNNPKESGWLIRIDYGCNVMFMKNIHLLFKLFSFSFSFFFFIFCFLGEALGNESE